MKLPPPDPSLIECDLYHKDGSMAVGPQSDGGARFRPTVMPTPTDYRLAQPAGRRCRLRVLVRAGRGVVSDLRSASSCRESQRTGRKPHICAGPGGDLNFCSYAGSLARSGETAESLTHAEMSTSSMRKCVFPYRT